MSVTKSQLEGKVVIRVDGEFNFKLHREFRDAYSSEPPRTVVEIDLSRVSGMDSSALGMLLLLRQHFGDEQARVSLVNSSAEVRKILDVAHFKNFFEIR